MFCKLQKYCASLERVRGKCCATAGNNCKASENASTFDRVDAHALTVFGDGASRNPKALLRKFASQGSIAPWRARPLGFDEQGGAPLGYALGGAAASRLGARLGMHLSGTTVLREMRRAGCAPVPAPSIIGIDDWAIARGHRYGTIVVIWSGAVQLSFCPGARWRLSSPG